MSSEHKSNKKNFNEKKTRGRFSPQKLRVRFILSDSYHLRVSQGREGGLFLNYANIQILSLKYEKEARKIRRNVILLGFFVTYPTAVKIFKKIRSEVYNIVRKVSTTSAVRY
jgi:hypothetical protein